MSGLSFRHRRAIAMLFTSFMIGILGIWAWVESSRLGHASFLTGGTVLASLLILILLGVRRRLPVLPLGSVSTWTQVHLYVGFFATGAYIMHVPALVAGGMFECALSILFLLVTFSGFYGIYASRTLPRRLTAVEGQHRFDRVDWHRDQIAVAAGGMLDEIRGNVGAGVLKEFYSKSLRPFFETRPSMRYILVPTGARRRRLLGGLSELHRYLEPESRSTAGRFAALVRRRDDLDYQFALQLRLRLWLVIHGVFSIALVAGGLVHAVLAWRYAG